MLSETKAKVKLPGHPAARAAILAAAATALAAAPAAGTAPASAAPTAAGAPALPAAASAKKPWTVDDILRIRDVTDPQVSPDGRWVVCVVSEADEKEHAFNTDLYLAPTGAAAPPAGAVRLTRSPKPDHHPRWSPGGEVIAFLSGREAGPPKEGDEKGAEKVEQVWMIRPDGGEAWLPGPVAGSVADLVWSPDGRTLALLVREPRSEERKMREKEKDDAVVVDAEIRRSQVWLMDAATGAAVQVTRGTVHVTSADWSPDGTRLVVAGQPTPKVPDVYRSDIYTIDPAKALAALREAAARPAPAAPDPNAPPPPALAEPAPLVTTAGPDTEPRWSPDGATIAFLTQDGSAEWFSNAYVASVPAAGGAPRVLTRALDEEADDPRFTPDGRSIVFEALARLSGHLFRIPAGGGPVEAISRGDGLHRAVSLSRDGRVAAFVREGSVAPPEVHVAELPASGPLGPARAVTGLNAWTEAFATIPKEPVRWKGAGGMEMEGLLVRPAGPAAGARAPLLTIVHGGPAGVFNNNFSVRRGVYPVQLFAQKGFAVFLPNPRGSGAYGEAFRKANVRDWGEKDYEDIMLGIDALVASGTADADRLGIMGWSYGGFMTSRVLTKTRRFRAASVGAGVTDTFSFTGVTDIPPFMRSYFGAWPWDDPAIYTSRTALFSAKGITTPTLIQHGDADARVPVSQGWELYVALKEQGVPVEFVTYPRQGHAITEPRLLRDAMERTLRWFSRWILGETGS
jgi:dipeptidyl aminopeptidase/acylaminoacyl peptidase